MVRLYSIPALLDGALFYAKLGNWDATKYYLQHLLPCLMFLDPRRIQWWIEDIVDSFRRYKKLTWNP